MSHSKTGQRKSALLDCEVWKKAGEKKKKKKVMGIDIYLYIFLITER